MVVSTGHPRGGGEVPPGGCKTLMFTSLPTETLSSLPDGDGDIRDL